MDADKKENIQLNSKTADAGQAQLLLDNVSLKSPLFRKIFLICLVVGLAALVVWQCHDMHELKKKAQSDGQITLRIMDSNLKRQIMRTEVLKAWIASGGDEQMDALLGGFDQECDRTFKALAKSLAPEDYVRSVVLAPKGEIMYAYVPNTEPEGFARNMFQSFDVMEDARLALNSRQPVVSEKINAGQPDERIVIFNPLYYKEESQKNKFWGMVCITLRMPDVLTPLGMKHLSDKGYYYRLYYNDGESIHSIFTNTKDVIYSPESMQYHITQKDWILELAPVDGWLRPWSLLQKFALVLMAAYLLSVVLWNARMHEQKEFMIRSLRKQAVNDQMTGLLNHNAMLAEVDKLLHERGGVMLLFDVDDFKQINDTLGHSYGDEILIYVAECMKQIFRHGDLLSRFGGDEFLIFLPGVTEMKPVEKRAQVLLDKLSEKRMPMLGALRVSMGIVQSRESDRSATDLFKRADLALYEVKHNGKGYYVILDSENHMYCQSDNVNSKAWISMAPQTRDVALSQRNRCIYMADRLIDMLFDNETAEEALKAALAFIGRYCCLSHANILEVRPGGEELGLTFAWCGANVETLCEDMDHVPIVEDGKSYFEYFDTSDVYYCPMPELIVATRTSYVKTQKLHAMFQRLLRVNGEVVGLIHFDECGSSRIWNESQKQLLNVASNVIAQIWHRVRKSASARFDEVDMNKLRDEEAQRQSQET